MTEHISFKIIDGGPDVLITLPGDIGCKDLERIGAEIQAALEQAELRGEQRALAFLRGDEVGSPLGIVKQPGLSNMPPGGDNEVPDDLYTTGLWERLYPRVFEIHSQRVAEQAFMDEDEANGARGERQVPLP